MGLSANNRIWGVHYAWIVVAAAFLAMLVASGLRSVFGVYVKPFEAEFHTDRANIALVASLSILINGVIQPVIGQMVDRYGTRKVAIGSLALSALGVVASSFVTEVWQLYITYGIIVSAAVGGPGTVLATAVATRWFVKSRGLIMGILSSGHSAGQLILIPLAMQLNLAYGWRMSYLLLGLGVLVLAIPIGRLIRNDPGDIGQQPFGAGSGGAAATAAQAVGQVKTPMVRAMRTHGFWMLALGFFICGYTAAGTVSIHLVPYTVERGFDNMTAATALGIMGFVNVVGTIVAGIITDRFGRRTPLAITYFVRGVALLYLPLADDAIKLNIFAIVFGMSYIATVPPTAALTAQLFGRLSVGTIFGVIFMSHQIGGAIGSYVTGLIFVLTGSYFSGFVLAAILCFVAAMASYSIREQPVQRPSPAVATG